MRAWLIAGLLLSGGAARAEAPPFHAPLFIGEPYRGQPGGHALIAAQGTLIWVAARDGLRRYDLSGQSLSRPAGLPEGPATAVVAGPREVWTAIDGTLFRGGRDGGFHAEPHAAWKEISYLALDGEQLWIAAGGALHARAADGRLRSIDLHRPDTYGEVVAMVSAAGQVTWASLYWSDRTGQPRSALVRVRGAEVKLFPHPRPGRVLAPVGLIAQPDGSVLVGLRDGRGDPIDDRYFHRFDGASWTTIGGFVSPYLEQADGTRRFVPNTGVPIAWEVAAGDGRFWIPENGRWLSVVPADPHEPRRPFPGKETGALLGVIRTPLGLFALGARRLARLHEGRWTVFSAPDRQGISSERTPPERPGFYPPTGLVLRPAAGEAPVARADGPRASRPLGAVDGVPFYREHSPMWMDGLPNEIDTDLAIYLPDLAPDQRFRFVGLNASEEIVSDASESPLVRLTRPLAGGGLVVSVEARPVFLPGAKPDEGALRFAPLETVTLLATSGPALEAARRFHRKNLDRIQQLLGPDVTPLPREMAHPAVHYDGRRERLVISTSELKHRRHTELSYVMDLHGRVEAVLGFSMFVGE